MKAFNLRILASVIGVSVLLGVIWACAPFRDSAYSSNVLHPERDLNTASVPGIASADADGKIRIAILADSHQNYKDLDKVVRQINRAENLDFVVNLGDATNSGYNLEFDQFLESYLILHPPTVNVIGNHDAIGAGADIFEKVFGELNFYTESASHRYIFFDSANLESQENFDPSWLKATVEASTKPVIIFTHVPLLDTERFTGETAQIFSAVLNNPKTQLVLNGHNHVYSHTSLNGTVLLQAGRVEGGQWLILEIQAQQLSITQMNTGEVEWDTLKP